MNLHGHDSLHATSAHVRINDDAKCSIIQAKACPAVLEDLLWGFMGFEGKYIKANRARSSKGSVSFHLEGKLDHAVHELVDRMLPIWYAPSKSHV